MLTIENIQRMVGYMCNSRTIKEFRNQKNERMGYESYVFAFKDDGAGYPDYDVHLDRDKNEQGKYELYVMGWASATKIELDRSDFKHPSDLAVMITTCLAKLDNYNFR